MSGEIVPAAQPVLSVEEFHVLTGGEFLELSTDDIRAMIQVMQLMAHIACEVSDRTAQPGGERP